MCVCVCRAEVALRFVVSVISAGVLLMAGRDRLWRMAVLLCEKAAPSLSASSFFLSLCALSILSGSHHLP